MTVQPTGVGNVSSSAILDLPNVNTNLPPPLLPNPSSHYQQQNHSQIIIIINDLFFRKILQVSRVFLVSYLNRTIMNDELEHRM